MSAVPGPGPRRHAGAYLLAADLLSFPSADVLDGLSHARLKAAHEVPGASTEHIAAQAGDADELASEYIRLFDAPDGPALPLYTGVYAARRRDAMEELLRFYRHFGLTISPATHDLPDHVPAVLEFLSLLAARGATSAEVDVLQRHLLPWVEATVQRLPARSPHPFYREAIHLVAAVSRAGLEPD